MKNVEQLGLVALNAAELEEVKGGALTFCVFPLIIVKIMADVAKSTDSSTPTKN